MKILNKQAIIRYHSGDVDLNVLLTSLIIDSAEEKKALIGFHAFTGNDYVSSFFGKVKLKCWKVLKSDPQFMNAFMLLGSAWEFDDETFKTLEKYVGKKRDVSVNEARYKVFLKRII